MTPIDYDRYRRVAAVERSRTRSELLRAAGRAICKGFAWIAERFHASRKSPAQRVRHHVRGQGSLSVSR